MSIKRIGKNQIDLIRDVALIVWPATFGEILSEKQLNFMMEMMYSKNSLEKQFDDGHEFYLYYEENQAIGFLGIELNYQGKEQLKIHKLYVLPSIQKKGIGKQFIDFAEKRCKELKCPLLTLNVNRYNKAVGFYEKLQFNCTKSEDIHIGKGYLMDGKESYEWHPNILHFLLGFSRVFLNHVLQFLQV